MQSYMVAAYTPQELEQTVCGANYVDLDMLKQITIYRNFPHQENAAHPSSVQFWNVLGSFTQEQLGSYLRYVWGRSRLSQSLSDRHKITYVSGGKANIPEAHTCFFEVDIGDYPDENDLRKKLLYGMENCTEIAERNNQLRFSADI